jgi:hypothetical protein
MVRYLRVRSPFMAVATSPSHKFVTIPAGAIIETFDDLAEPGLHRVKFGNVDLMAFSRDIHERTEQFEPALH